MKVRNFIAIFVCLSFAGCATSRHLESVNKQVAEIEDTRIDQVKREMDIHIDTTRTEGLEITYTRVEYYPPDICAVEHRPEGEILPDTQAAAPAVSSGSGRGPVKSVETCTIRQNIEEQSSTTASVRESEESKEELIADLRTSSELHLQEKADTTGVKLWIIVVILGACFLISAGMRILLTIKGHNFIG